MITPLRNMEEFSSRDEAEAARLLCTLCPADPLPGVEQRVYASLARPRRFGPTALRVASVVSVSLVTTGVFAMTMGMILLRGEEPHAPAASPSSPSPAPLVVVASPVSPLLPEPVPSVTPEPSVPVEPRAVSRSGSLRPSRANRRPVETPTDPGTLVAPVSSPAPSVAPVPSPAPSVAPMEATEAHMAAAPPEEAALVLAGLRALRRQHEPTQAGVLLAHYLNRFPQGALVQEALAIAIEAGLARGDRKAAAQLAGQYLERFPTGRFVRQARKAVGGTGP